jgi:hypothetical protein
VLHGTAGLDQAGNVLDHVGERETQGHEECLKGGKGSHGFRAATNQLTDTNQPKKARRNIARLLTAIREREQVEN